MNIDINWLNEKLRIACTDAADLFELEPETFTQNAYSRIDGEKVPCGLIGPVREGDSFCAVGALSYLTESSRYQVTRFLGPSLVELFGEVCVEEVNNSPYGREKVIDLLRHAAIRTDSATGKAK